MNKYLDYKIKECREFREKNPDTLTIFDLSKDNYYVVVSGLSHTPFKVLEKCESQYPGLPFYITVYVTPYGNKVSITGMVFDNYKRIEDIDTYLLNINDNNVQDISYMFEKYLTI